MITQNAPNGEKDGSCDWLRARSIADAAARSLARCTMKWRLKMPITTRQDTRECWPIVLSMRNIPSKRKNPILALSTNERETERDNYEGAGVGGTEEEEEEEEVRWHDGKGRSWDGGWWVKLPVARARNDQLLRNYMLHESIVSLTSPLKTDRQLSC